MDTNVSSWATAVSTHSGNGRKIIWRFAQVLAPAFDTRLLADRIIVAWRYASESGLPLANDHEQMNALEDLLEPITDAGQFATLALVSTGEGLREWTYYAKSGDNFVDRLNTALRAEPAFPIEISVASDPSWSMYYEFLNGVVAPIN